MSSTHGEWFGPWPTPGLGTNYTLDLPEGHPGYSDDPDLPEGIFVIHAVLLHTGKVLWWSGHAEDVHYSRECIEWDPKMSPDSPDFIQGPNIKFYTPPKRNDAQETDIDIFCCHHVQLHDGRIITIGGAGAGHEGGHGRGIKDICIFTPETGWELAGQLNEARWYPTPVVMPDGNIAIFSGRDESRPVGDIYSIAESVELIRVDDLDARKPNYVPEIITILKPDDAATAAADACAIFPTYPGMQLGPDGKIYHVGPNWRYEKSTRKMTTVTPVLKVGTAAFTLDTARANGQWEMIPENDFVNSNREEGTCVLLPPAQSGKILVLGGARMTDDDHPGNPPWPPLEVGVDPESAHILDTLVDPVTYIDIPDGMIKPRINVSSVVLPDRTTLIIGGHNHYKWATEGELSCELFDSDTLVFNPAASLHQPRTYHSAALLLPDGSVVVAGGVNPTLNEFDGQNIVDDDGAVRPYTMPLNIKTMEIYRPPYFYKGARPVISAISDVAKTMSLLELDYGNEFIIESPQAATIEHVAFMRPGSMTHHTDTEQRYVNIPFTHSGGNDLQCTLPADPKVMPPGYYMVWIIDSTRRPCVEAQFIKVNRQFAENGEVMGSLEIAIDENTTDTTVAYGGGNYTIQKKNGVPVGLLVNGMMVPLEHHPRTNSYGSHHLIFTTFKSIEQLAEYLIDNHISPMSMS